MMMDRPESWAPERLETVQSYEELSRTSFFGRIFELSSNLLHSFAEIFSITSIGFRSHAAVKIFKRKRCLSTRNKEQFLHHSSFLLPLHLLQSWLRFESWLKWSTCKSDGAKNQVPRKQHRLAFDLCACGWWQIRASPKDPEMTIAIGVSPTNLQMPSSFLQQLHCLSFHLLLIRKVLVVLGPPLWLSLVVFSDPYHGSYPKPFVDCSYHPYLIPFYYILLWLIVTFVPTSSNHNLLWLIVWRPVIDQSYCNRTSISVYRCMFFS